MSPKAQGIAGTTLKPWQPTEKQQTGIELLASPNFDRILFDGGARSGKTVSIAMWMITRAIQFPGSKQLGARMRQVDMRHSGWVTFKELLYNHIPKDWWFLREKAFQIQFKNGSYISFSGLDTQERVDFILGTEWLTIFLNEATQVPFDTVTTIMSRLSQKVSHADDPTCFGIPKIVLDCNPRHRKHWIYLMCVKANPIVPFTDPPKPVAEDVRWGRLHWSPFDNAQHLPNSFFVTLENLPKVKRARMKDGIWMDNEGAVYDEFDEDIHCIETFDIPSNWKRVRSIDFGYTNPFCCLWGAVDGDDNLYIYNEHYMKEKIVREHARIINAMSHGEAFRWTTADWDAEDRETLSYCGIPTVAADKNIEMGLQAVKSRLKEGSNGKPRIYVMAERCPHLISEFYDYMWDPHAGTTEKNLKEVPVDSNNHAMDALRYMVMRCDHPMPSVRAQGVYHHSRRRELDAAY